MKVNPIVRSIVNPIVTNIVSIASSISRYFQSYNGSTSFGVLATPKVFTGDFSISIDIATTTIHASSLTLIGDSTADTDWFRIDTVSNRYDFKINNHFSANIPCSASIADGTINTIKIVRDFATKTIEIFEDEVSKGTDTNVNYDFPFEVAGVGCRKAGSAQFSFFTGTLANLILTDDALSETLTFPLVSNDIEYPNERDTTEHMTNGDFVTDDLTGWTPSNATQSVVNNSLELVDAGGSAHTIHLLLVPHADTDYDISIGIRAAAGNTNPLAASVKLGGTVYRVSAEDTTETITATVSSSNFGYIEIYCATWGGSNGDTAYFSNISVQKASNYLTFTDVTLIELP